MQQEIILCGGRWTLFVPSPREVSIFKNWEYATMMP